MKKIEALLVVGRMVSKSHTVMDAFADSPSGFGLAGDDGLVVRSLVLGF